MIHADRGRERTGRIPGSGNVFADVGLPDAEELLAKARLAEAIDDAIAAAGLTQAEAGRRMGVDQGSVSKLVNGRLDGFSQERLIRYLLALGTSVEIVVGRAGNGRGAGRLTVTRG